MKYLRPVQLYDIEWIRLQRNTSRNLAVFRQNKELTQKEQEAFWNKEFLNLDHHHFIIEDDSQRRGYCYLKEDIRHKSAEFGIFTLPNTNVGLYAMRELLKFGFSQLNLNRIWSDVIQDNPALRLYKLLGFSEEGVLRQAYFKNDSFVDSIVISILKSEYETPNRWGRANGSEAWQDTSRARRRSYIPRSTARYIQQS